MQTSTAFAPPTQPEFRTDLQSDSFAAFLARLAELPDWDANPNASSDTGSASAHFAAPSPSTPANLTEEDILGLSYEQALRPKTRTTPPPLKARAKKFTLPSLPSRLAGKAALATTPSPTAPAASAALDLADPRRCRTTIRFTAAEHELVLSRAEETGLAVSAYVRSCVLEVESLRAQIGQLVAEMRSAAPNSATRPSYSVSDSQTPAIAAPSPQPALPSPQAPRPMQPLTARAPQPVPARRLDPRIQAAFDAQKQLSAQFAQYAPTAQTAPPKPKPRIGLLGFLFGSRRSA